MIEAFDRQKRKAIAEFEVDDKVTVRVNKIDRLALDTRRLPGIIIKKSGENNIFYTIVTKNGVLKGNYRAGDLEYFYGEVDIDDNQLQQ